MVFDDAIHNAEHPKRVKKYKDKKSNSVKSDKSPPPSSSKGKKSKYIVNDDYKPDEQISEKSGENSDKPTPVENGHTDKFNPEHKASSHYVTTNGELDHNNGIGKTRSVSRKELSITHITNMEKQSPSELSSPDVHRHVSDDKGAASSSIDSDSEISGSGPPVN